MKELLPTVSVVQAPNIFIIMTVSIHAQQLLSMESVLIFVLMANFMKTINATIVMPNAWHVQDQLQTVLHAPMDISAMQDLASKIVQKELTKMATPVLDVMFLAKNVNKVQSNAQFVTVAMSNKVPIVLKDVKMDFIKII